MSLFPCFLGVVGHGFGQFLCKDVFGDVEFERCLFDVFLPFDHVGNDGNGANDFFEDFGFADGIVLDVFEEYAGFEFDEILFVGAEVFMKLSGTVFLGVAVGVFAVGEENDTDVHAFLEEEVDGSEGGFDAGGVAIVENRDVGSVAFDEADLFGGEGGAAGGHGIAYA